MLDNYGGATRIYFILGHPIAQVKAPSGLTRHFEQNGRDAIVVPIDVAPADFGAFFSAATALRNVDGLIFTVPHKFDAAARCATLSQRSRLLASSNIARRNADGGWHGDMLDGTGSIAAMRARGCEPAGRRALLIGAGGAGSAIGLELLDSGVESLAIHDTDPARRDDLIARLSTPHPGRATIGSADPTGFGIVANVTPAGMRPDDPLPVDIAKLSADMFVSDAITLPEITPLLAAARKLGCGISTGADMFEAERQSMLDFWFGEAAQHETRISRDKP
ncbi:shikimate dehydrogenase [Mesorhizobium sp. CAU 1732]|uniref:shikimate dehydrogenase family protein n=1 Tax=Mesorhizobium sp. CAU 1732 TaxID=3140358 RepID=UPI0032609CCE